MIVIELIMWSRSIRSVHINVDNGCDSYIKPWADNRREICAPDQRFLLVLDLIFTDSRNQSLYFPGRSSTKQIISFSTAILSRSNSLEIIVRWESIPALQCQTSCDRRPLSTFSKISSQQRIGISQDFGTSLVFAISELRLQRQHNLNTNCKTMTEGEEKRVSSFCLLVSKVYCRRRMYREKANHGCSNELKNNSGKIHCSKQEGFKIGRADAMTKTCSNLCSETIPIFCLEVCRSSQRLWGIEGKIKRKVRDKTAVKGHQQTRQG